MADDRTDDFSEEDERLARLFFGFADGDLNETELAQWDAELAQSDQLRETFVAACLQRQLLLQSHAMVSESGEGANAPPLQSSGILGLLGSTWQGANSYLMSHEMFAGYVIAAVLLGVAALIGLNVRATSLVGGQTPTVGVSSPAIPQSDVPRHEVVSVGRVTDMVEVVWANTRFAPSMQRILLGDRFALAAGLVEITYDTGAKVILEGPCVYEVESKTGGFLERGRLTARVEKEERGRRGKGEAGRLASPAAAASLKSQARDADPKSRIEKSPTLLLSPSPPLFSVRTPTAVVNDLGTEFGIEVDRQGATQAHVFCGMVELCAVDAAGRQLSGEQTLTVGQAARVAAGGKGKQPTVVKINATATKALSAGFVRRIPISETITLDLIDVVAGGNGLGKARDRGIDPANGRIVESFRCSYSDSDGRYHRVSGRLYIDGVFILKANSAVQLDSAGHVFDAFGNNESRSARYIWSSGRILNDEKGDVDTTIDGVDYAAPGRGLLHMHANVGITFDLEAIRRANSHMKTIALNGVLGCGRPCAGAEVFALVDGEERVRMTMTKRGGSQRIRVGLNNQNHFLTLVVTDGGNGYSNDWIIFGDLRLTLVGYPGLGDKNKK
jgi:hypothetical protein